MQGTIWFVAGAVLAAGAIALGRWSGDGAAGFRCRYAWCKATSLARSLAHAGRDLAGRPAGTLLELVPPQVPPNLVPEGSDSHKHGACCDQHWEFLERQLYLLGIQSKWEQIKPRASPTRTKAIVRRARGEQDSPIQISSMRRTSSLASGAPRDAVCEACGPPS
jgi:hypothetical protein